jgi:hypothetical protein
MNANIQYSASVTVDGEVRSVSNSETIEVTQVVTGSQTIGNTYEILQGVSMPQVGMVLYNKGTVDVSVRISFISFTTNEYIFYNLLAGGVLVIQPLHQTDDDSITTGETIYARTASGTAIVEYCWMN